MRRPRQDPCNSSTRRIPSRHRLNPQTYNVESEHITVYASYPLYHQNSHQTPDPESIRISMTSPTLEDPS